MPQYTSQTQQPDGTVVNAVLDTTTNSITYTVTTSGGITATNTQPANIPPNQTAGGSLATLRAQLRSQGAPSGGIGISLAAVTDEAKENAQRAAAAATATDTPVPAAPNPPPPASSTTDPAVPAPAQVPAPAVSAPAEVTTDDPFEARRLELEQEFNDPPPTLTAEDVGEEDPFEARRLELEQEQNREELAASNFDPEPVGEEDPFEARRLEREREFDEGPPTLTADDVANDDPAVRALDEESRQEAEARSNEDFDPDSDTNARTKALLKETQEQASIQQFFNQTTKGDWRVRLRIAPDADYLYQDKSNALLAPLRVSDGVVFPYTPIINTSYAAKYDPYDLTHSNYRGYFYRGSQVSDVQIQATFTAQDTREAEYVLAVIQFFRSATKMFYGKDQQRGSPPPLVYLRGYGEYQFNDHACVITNFQYNLPNDVDYIAVTPNNIGLNMSNRLNQVGSSPVSTISSAIGRLSNLFNAATGQPGVPKGAGPGDRGDLGLTRQTVSGLGQATYVPTKIDMNITLLPIQTRSQVSKQFSVKEFANGNLLKGGFW